MNFGEKIKDFRKLKTLSRKEMSEITGVSAGYIEEIESGKKTPTIEILYKISTAFNITVSELIGETQNDLAPELKELLNNAKTLDIDQIQKLNAFIQSISTGHTPKFLKTKINGQDTEYMYNADEISEEQARQEAIKADELSKKIVELAKRDPEARKKFEAAGFRFKFEEEK